MAKKRGFAGWQRQPPGPFDINRGHERADGLVFFAPLSGAHGTLDLVKQQLGTRTGLEAYLPTQNGALHHLFGGSNFADFPELPDITSTTPATIAWTQEARSNADYSTILTIKPTGATNSFLIYQSGTVNSYYFAVGPRTGASIPLFGGQVGGLVDGALDRYVLTITGGLSSTTLSHYVLWKNGVRYTTASSTTFGVGTAAVFRVGGLETAGDPFEGLIGDMRIWSRVLSDEDAEEESTVSGSYVLYSPRRILVPVSAGGGGGSTTITAGIGGATAAGHTASIALRTAIAVGVGAADAQGHSASVTVGSATFVSAGVGAAVAAGHAVTITEHTVVAAGIGAASAAGQTAGIAAHTVISGAVGDATAAGHQASVATHTVIGAGVGASVAAGHPATISLGSGITVGAGVGDAVASGHAATIAEHIVVAAGVGGGQAQGHQAQISLHTAIPVTIGDGIAQGYPAALSLHSAIQAGVGAAQAQGHQALITATSGLVLSAGSRIALMPDVTQIRRTTNMLDLAVIRRSVEMHVR